MRFLSLFLILLITSSVLAKSGDFDIDKVSLSGRIITSSDGLLNNTVYDITQDNDGFIWMGTIEGFCRYDGYSFKNFHSINPNDSFPSETHIGKFYIDKERNLLWIQTAIYTFTCYDLTTGQFLNYTNNDDAHLPFRHFIFIPQGDVWLYENSIRHIQIHKNNPLSSPSIELVCTDYFLEKGVESPGTKIYKLVYEEAHKSMWVFSNNGITIIDSTEKCKTIVEGRRYLNGAIWQDKVICLAENNIIELRNNTGELLKSLVIPKEITNLNSLRSLFVWNNKWMLFAKKTIEIDLETWSYDTKTYDGIRNGLLLDDDDGYFFISDDKSDLIIFKPDGTFKTLSLLSNEQIMMQRNRKYSVSKHQNGLFYIASWGNGLFLYDPNNDKLRHFKKEDEGSVISTNYLTGIYIDRDDNLWITQGYYGIALIKIEKDIVANFIVPSDDTKHEWSNWINMIAKTFGTRLLFSTRDSKIYTYDTKTDKIVDSLTTPFCITAYNVTPDGHNWTATNHGELYKDNDPMILSYNIKSASANDINDIKIDNRGRTWFASTENGLIMARSDSTNKLHFEYYLSANINQRRTHRLHIDDKGWLWIATSDGLFAVDTNKKIITDGDFIQFNAYKGDLPFNKVTCTLRCNDTLYIGGIGLGLVIAKIKNLEEGVPTLINLSILTTKEGLSNNSIYSMIQDEYGNVWVATENGLNRINPRTLMIESFILSNVKGRNNYIEADAISLDDRRIAFGTHYGLVIITPMKENISSFVPQKPYLVDFKVNGKSLEEGNFLTQTINNTERITLKYNENTIALSFSTLDFTPQKTKIYRYWLEGVDKTWREASAINTTNYDNLKPRKYVFHLQSLISDTPSEEKILEIRILQPWYNTTLAWMIYVILATVLLVYIFYNAKRKFKLHQQFLLERKLTEFKLDFFTSIAHEFRTPLAIIKGSIDRFSEKEIPSKSALQTARRGVERLLRMVNSLLEFRKISTDSFRLQVEMGDIIALLRGIYANFVDTAQFKEQTITFTPFQKQYNMVFDKGAVELIFYNLLSNALKYTPQKGKINITVKLSDFGDISDNFNIENSNQRNRKYIEITVKDNGPGINNEQLKDLFQPFMHGKTSQGGMGIGLFTSYKTAKTHKGDLFYSSSKDNNGAVFTLILPTDASVYADHEYKKECAIKNLNDFENSENSQDSLSKDLLPKALNDLKIIVIEDDPDMNAQISNALGEIFFVESYGTAEQGIQAIKTSLPSLVICDVMLGGRDGYDVIKEMKLNEVTRKIPSIMLTALNDDKHRLKGFEIGADDYITKPCNYKILVTRAIQLIKNYEQSRADKRPNLLEVKSTQESLIDKSISSESSETLGNVEDPQAIIITSRADKMFIEQVNKLIKQHMDDPAFNIDSLSEALNMGRTKFFSKMKLLTGMTPNNYLQKERMQTAAELLREGFLSVSEVCYRVGIHDTSYFNRCFKSYFGISPGKYRKA